MNVRPRPAVTFEALEARTLLSGTVLAKVVSNNLIITGDGADNSITITRAGDEYTILGNLTGVNDDVGASMTASGNVVIKMLGGSDTVIFQDTFIGNNTFGVRKNVKVDFGTGTAETLQMTGDCEMMDLLVKAKAALTVDVVDGKIWGNASINSAAGNDSIGFEGVTIGKNLTVNAGHGDNLFWLESGDNNNVIVYGNLKYKGGLGADELYLRGDDIGNDGLLEGTVSVYGTTCLLTGAGDDTVHIRFGTSFANTVKIDTGAGSDTVRVGWGDTAGNFILGGFTLNTGAGNDTVTLDPVTIARDTKVNLGAGDDDLETDITRFRGKTTLDGGAGLNILVGNDGTSFVVPPVLKNWVA